MKFRPSEEHVSQAKSMSLKRLKELLADEVFQEALAAMREAESVVVDDEITRPQSADCVADRIGAVDPRFVERRHFGDRCCKVALAVALSGKALFESGNARVGLVLRERSGQQRSGGVGVESLKQVGGHVVGGPKCRPQPEAFAAGEARDLFEPDER